MYFMRYDYKVFHTPGSKICIVDPLSMPPVGKETARIVKVEMHTRSLLATK